MDEQKVTAEEAAEKETEEVKEEINTESAEPIDNSEQSAAEPEDKKSKKKKEKEPSPLEKLEAEKQELTDRYLRLMAEYDNYRKRTQKERDAIYPDAVCNTVKELLPVLDNLERALATPCSDENYRKGVEMISTGVEGFLSKMGIETFGEAGETFDPNFHDAMMHIDDENLEKNVVAQVFQKGYKKGDKIIRHAMVQQAN